MKICLLSAFVLTFCLLTGVTQGFAQDDLRVFYVKVARGTELSGQIVEISEFKVKTEFGDVTIPIEKVEGIKLDADGQGSAVLAFTNGDMVTGKIEMEKLELKTNWGKAHINTDTIDSISAAQYGRFYSDPTGGGWRFSRGNSNTNPGSATRGNNGRQRIFNGR